MGRFLQEVTDEAHGREVLYREVHLTSHPRPLSQEGRKGLSTPKQISS